jgi:hypothetical protein
MRLLTDGVCTKLLTQTDEPTKEKAGRAIGPALVIATKRQ